MQDDVKKYKRSGGRFIGENGEVINVADKINSLDGKGFATQTTLSSVLTKLGELEIELQTIKANQPKQIDEYLWLSNESAPVLGENDRAIGVEVNVNTHEMTTMYWTGTEWQEVA